MLLDAKDAELPAKLKAESMCTLKDLPSAPLRSAAVPDSPGHSPNLIELFMCLQRVTGCGLSLLQKRRFTAAVSRGAM